MVQLMSKQIRINVKMFWVKVTNSCAECGTDGFCMEKST